MTFATLSLVVGAVLIAAGIGVLRPAFVASPAVVGLPRSRLVGELLGIVCLVWSAYHASLMLEGGLAVYRRFLWLLVPVVAALAYGHLEYLLARSLGGIAILCASSMTHGAFVAHLSYRPVYAFLCYLVGISGLFLIGIPWRFRDLLGAMQRSRPCRAGVAVICLVVGTGLAALPWLRA